MSTKKSDEVFVLQRFSTFALEWQECFAEPLTGTKAELEVIRDRWVQQHGNAPDLLRIIPFPQS